MNSGAKIQRISVFPNFSVKKSREIKKHHKFNTKKVGHTGTLDPNASGVLIICLGKALKMIELMEEQTAKDDSCFTPLHFVNRTSDFLFVLARFIAFAKNEEEEPWSKN